MEDHDEASIGTVPSPCVRNCCLDEKDICMGCHRSLPEICGWHDAPEQEKLEILARCRSRYKDRFERQKR